MHKIVTEEARYWHQHGEIGMILALKCGEIGMILALKCGEIGMILALKCGEIGMMLAMEQHAIKHDINAAYCLSLARQ